MCCNCGCGKPGDDMGDPKNITDKTFEKRRRLPNSLRKRQKETHWRC